MEVMVRLVLLDRVDPQEIEVRLDLLVQEASKECLEHLVKQDKPEKMVKLDSLADLA